MFLPVPIQQLRVVVASEARHLHPRLSWDETFPRGLPPVAPYRPLPALLTFCKPKLNCKDEINRNPIVVCNFLDSKFSSFEGLANSFCLDSDFFPLFCFLNPPLLRINCFGVGRCNTSKLCPLFRGHFPRVQFINSPFEPFLVPEIGDIAWVGLCAVSSWCKPVCLNPSLSTITGTGEYLVEKVNELCSRFQPNQSQHDR